MEGTTVALLCMNKPGALLATLDLLRKTLVEPYEMIIVDNGSTDERTLSIFSDIRDPNWRIIRNETNRGLSVGTNQGLEAGKYDCLIHIDDDVLIEKMGWNQVLRDYLVKCPELGLVAPGHVSPFIQQDGYREVCWALGMVWAIRKSLIDDIGGYDPQLHHQNECDLALRVRLAGYKVGCVQDFFPIHNDPGVKSESGAAREHVGCVQFRDKWASYFNGRNWNYGTQPLSLMQHWPPDQEFLRRFALAHGLALNPLRTDPQREGESFQEHWDRIDEFAKTQLVDVGGEKYLIWRALRNDYAHWENSDAYVIDRQKAIDRWHELTGELYTGYKWAVNILRPY